MTSSFQLTMLFGLTVVAGMLMASAGLAKKMLAWKVAPRRCPTCGRTPNHDCRCRR